MTSGREALVGTVEGPLVRTQNLSSAALGELVWCEGNVPCVVLELGVGREVLGALAPGVARGQRLHASGTLLSIAADRSLLGRVVDVLGRPLDGREPCALTPRVRLGAPPFGFGEREAPSGMLPTGYRWIDLLQPLREGSAQLLVGAPCTGKSTLAASLALGHARFNGPCIFVAVGWELSRVAALVRTLRAGGALERTVLVVARASDPLLAKVLAPEAGASLAEHFARQGERALLVVEGLSEHALVATELASVRGETLALGAYSAGLVAQQTALLDRAGRRLRSVGGGSLTIVATVEERFDELSTSPFASLVEQAPWVLDEGAARRGASPALSVASWRTPSLYGDSTHPRGLRRWAASARRDFFRARELRAWLEVPHGTTLQDLDATSRRELEHAERLEAMLQQNPYEPCSPAEVLVRTVAVVSADCEHTPPGEVAAKLDAFVERVRLERPRLLETLPKEHDPSIPEQLRELLPT